MGYMWPFYVFCAAYMPLLQKTNSVNIKSVLLDESKCVTFTWDTLLLMKTWRDVNKIKLGIERLLKQK